MKQGRWQDAYPLLIEAWKNKQHWQIALNLGRTELEIRKYRDAVEHLTFAEAQPDASADGQKEAASLKEQARAKLGHVRIDASPRGARVLIDGQVVDKAPVAGPIAVDPGAHDVELRVGDQRTGEHVEVKSGEVTNVVLQLRILDPVPTVSVPNRTPEPKLVSEPDKPSPARTALLVSGGVLTLAGFVLSGASVGVFVEQGKLARQAKETKTGQHAITEATYKDVAFWSFAGAAAVGLGTIAYYLLSAPAKAPVTAAAFASPHGGGMFVEGRF